ncbi:DUF4261 domain-containing protein [Paenibacillus azoreducens]|uniref:DUF4261 domain-containing protein n=1 Tax=Paenibacillus azoreducens TaxID=116718 RepID=UPI0039F48A2E
MPSGFFFRVHGTEDSLIDSLGLFTLGLPDIQYHFHTLDPNDVSRHAFNAAAYSFEADVPVSDGEMIAGLLDGEIAPDVHWPCQFEMALVSRFSRLNRHLSFTNIPAVGYGTKMSWRYVSTRACIQN